ncbi:MAG: hypothetical protein M1816_003654 [Peltula sp. TS41687]|nr:MAG: hypothetical protein M1816_003654 [Peltula sp. TS41687]
MPSILSDDDKETVKRTVPKPSNKIHAVAVARLYIAYPDRQRWTDTGLQGAAVLANDLVGNTYWLKLVDISPSNRGVIWDQEIYDGFSYNQDRTFFHSFELEECLAALSFVDEKEAKQFKKKIDEREKNASKATKANPFRHQSGGPVQDGHTVGTRKTSLLGGITNLLHSHRTPSPSNPVPPVEPSRPSLLPPELPSEPHLANGTTSSGLEEVDPSWRGLLDELKAMGITEDQIAENADFIKSYVEQKQGANSKAADMNGLSGVDRRPPPPPPPSVPADGNRANSISPQNTGSTTSSKRGPPPAPPPSRRSRIEINNIPSPPDTPTSASMVPAPPSQSPPSGPPPPRFRAPPPIADAGKYAHSDSVPVPPPRAPVSSISGPPPPPRPPKVPMDDSPPPKTKFAVPPALDGERFPSSSIPPRPPPSRNIPSPATNRESTQSTLSNLGPPPPPPLPGKAPNGRPMIPGGAPPSIPAPPPPPAVASPFSATGTSNQANIPVAPPPPTLPSTPRPSMMDGIPAAPPPPAPPLPGFSSSSSVPPAPPPPPPAAPPLPSFSSPSNIPPAPPPPPPPPPPSFPSSSGNVPPPPPPLPTNRDSGYQSGTSSAPALHKPAGGQEDVLASIRATGGIGGGRLRKVDESQKRDRSAVAIPGSGGGAGSGADHNTSSSSTPAATGGDVGLAGALAAALSKRKTRVSQSDDEEEEDDWDDTPKTGR